MIDSPWKLGLIRTVQAKKNKKRVTLRQGSCCRPTTVSLQGHARRVRTRGCSLQVLSAHRGPDLVSQTGAHAPNKKRSSGRAFMSLSKNRSILQTSHGMGSAGTRWNSPGSPHLEKNRAGPCQLKRNRRSNIYFVERLYVRVYTFWIFEWNSVWSVKP